MRPLTDFKTPDRRLEPPEDDGGSVQCVECEHLHAVGSRVCGYPVAYCDVLDECIGKATYELPRGQVCDWPCWEEPVVWGARR